MGDCHLARSMPDISCCILLQVAGYRNGPPICSKLFRWYWCDCLPGYIELNDSWYLMLNRNKKEILQWKGRLMIFVSTHCQYLTWNTYQLSSHNIQLALLFWQKCQSTHRFYYVQVVEMYNLDIKDSACLHVVHSLQHPISHPTTRTTQDKMGNAPKNKHFSTCGGPLQQLNNEVHMSTSSSEWRQEPHGGRTGTSIGSIAQLPIYKESASGEKTGNAGCKHW
jgi:hypothetical protein